MGLWLQTVFTPLQKNDFLQTFKFFYFYQSLFWSKFPRKGQICVLFRSVWLRLRGCDVTSVNLCCCFLFLLQVNAAVNSLLAPGSATNTLTPTVITSHALVNTRLSVSFCVCSQLAEKCRSSSYPAHIAAADELRPHVPPQLRRPSLPWNISYCFVFPSLFCGAQSCVNSAHLN